MKNLHIPASVQQLLDDKTRHTIRVFTQGYDTKGPLTPLGLFSVDGEGYSALVDGVNSNIRINLPENGVEAYVSLCSMIPHRLGALEPNAFFYWWDEVSHIALFLGGVAKFHYTDDHDGIYLLVRPRYESCGFTYS